MSGINSILISVRNVFEIFSKVIHFGLLVFKEFCMLNKTIKTNVALVLRGRQNLTSRNY